MSSAFGIDKESVMPSEAVESDKKDEKKSERPMMGLLLLSIFCSAANTVSYKQTLNAFSSPTTNYSFFVSEFSIFLYIIQAAIMSAFIMWQQPDTIREFLQVPHKIYVYMGFFDSASSTLGAFAGVYCPGELQTILNQLIIPITLLGSYYIGDKFSNAQLYGCGCILAGAIVASSGYLFLPKHSDEATGITDDQSSSSTSHAMALPVAIVLYLASVVPSACSNIYKEQRMKERDMNEYHTSSVVSFWQLWIGFAFLPLLSLPSLGGMTYAEMKNQLSDGFSCFLGSNPNDPSSDSCSNAALLFMAYVIINFFYNILLLKITKHGSAVLLVISQALSLPVTNICFSLPFLMGEDADSLSMCSLVGVVLVVIGFLTYSGFGFAKSFMVAQGPPGQMTYAHFSNSKEVIVSTDIASTASGLADFLVTSIIQNNVMLFEEAQEKKVEDSQESYSTSSYQSIPSNDEEAKLPIDISPLGATIRALEVAKDTVKILEKQASVLRNRKTVLEYQMSKDIMKSKYHSSRTRHDAGSPSV